MLQIELKEKIINIKDDNFTKPKIKSIKKILNKYKIKNKLNFKITITKDLLGISQHSYEVFLNKSISHDKYYQIIIGYV